MKKLAFFVAAAAIVTTIYWFKLEKNEQQEQFVTESTQLIKQLGGSLKQELSKSIKKDGIPAAIQTCNIQAPILTAQTHAESPLTIRRTSLKLRNPSNAPDNWEKEILQKFDQQLAQGESVEQLAYTEIIKGDGPDVYRYMRAIPTQAICLNCHGDEKILSSEVKSMLNKEYPNDLAIGYSVGEIRGAFSISKIIDK